MALPKVSLLSRQFASFQPGVEEWKCVFLITSGVLTFAITVYSVCAQGQELPWARTVTRHTEEDGEEEEEEANVGLNDEELTLWSLEKSPYSLTIYFTAFEWKPLNLDWNFTEIWS